MPWTDLDLSVPDDSTQNGSQAVQSIQDNQHALWNFIMMGAVKGMNFSVTVGGGTAEQPDTFTWSNGVNRLKAAITWGAVSGSTGNFSSIDWSVSQDNGGSYDPVCTQAFTYDSNGNLTATSGAGGLVSMLAYTLGRFKNLASDVADINTQLLTFTAMSSQDPTNVLFTGGSIKGVTVGGTAGGEAKLGTFLANRNKVVDLGSGTPANTFTIDWNAGNVFLCAPGANFTFAETNVPANGFEQECLLVITGAAGFTATLPAGYGWGSAGAPTFTAGPDLVSVVRTGHASAPVKRFVTKSLA
jgi:hypothetical protein